MSGGLGQSAGNSSGSSVPKHIREKFRTVTVSLGALGNKRRGFCLPSGLQPEFGSLIATKVLGEGFDGGYT